MARESKPRAVTPPATGVDPQKAALELLDQMRRFCTPGTCRHQALSEYFGQTYEPPCSSEAIDTHADGDDDDAGVQIAEGCGACDVCLGETDGWVDGTRDAQMVLSCVARLGQMGTAYGMNHVVDVLPRRRHPVDPFARPQHTLDLGRDVGKGTQGVAASDLPAHRPGGARAQRRRVPGADAQRPLARGTARRAHRAARPGARPSRQDLCA